MHRNITLVKKKIVHAESKVQIKIAHGGQKMGEKLLPFGRNYQKLYRSDAF